MCQFLENKNHITTIKVCEQTASDTAVWYFNMTLMTF